MSRSALFAAFAGAIALAVQAAAASPAVASTCQPYGAVAHDSATSPTGPYVGTADITIGDTTYTDVLSVTNILALTPAGNSGVSFVTTSHSIALPTGTITTIDSAKLIPTQAPGIFHLVSHLMITGGATGELELQGTTSFATFPFTASGTFTGTICGA